MTDANPLTYTQRALVELAAANRVQVKVNPRTKRLRSVKIRGDTNGRTLHPITVAAAMEVGLVKLGKFVDAGTYYIEPTPLGHARLKNDTEARPMSVNV